MTESRTRTERLAQWAANLRYHDLPEEVIQRTKELFIDWLGCTIAGRHHPAVAAIVRFATQMGPSSGKSEVIDGSLGLTSSPAFASLINGASSHVVEQDDLHNRSIMHPVCLFNWSIAQILMIRQRWYSPLRWPSHRTSTPMAKSSSLPA